MKAEPIEGVVLERLTAAAAAARSRRVRDRDVAAAGVGGLVAERRVTLVGMEATGVDWKPVHWVLEGSIPEVWVVDAWHVRTCWAQDRRDAVWGASLLEHGLVRPSFIPLHKVLEDAGVKLSSVASVC